MAKKATAMKKTETVAYLAEAWELEKKQVKTILDGLPELIGTRVQEDGVFVLPGLARFQKRDVPAVKAKTKKVRNPATGEMIWQKPRPASLKVSIRPARQLKDAVNG